ncbi:MAG: molybdate ABC transporter substrate-binding protein [Terricaulis silvestris]
MMKRTLLGAVLALVIGALAQPAFAAPLKVFAAASLTDALNAVGDAYARDHHERPVFNFAASSTLARQIEQGAEADVFMSADEDWMDYLQTRALIDTTTRVDVLTNRLVLIAPTDHPFHVTLRHGLNLSGALNGGRLAMADPDSVPAGRYGRAALQSLGAWDGVQSAVVRAENVRAALRFVETGEAAAGIVYATDAQASHHVVVAGVFPEASHPPIRYPLAIVAGRANTDARDFARFLRSGEARAIFRAQGFGLR